MATLDYAFLADYAKVQPNGTLTSVGASFTFVEAQSLPTTHRMAVAARVRARIDEQIIPFRVEITGPGESFRLGVDGQLSPGPDSRPYGEGFVGHLLAMDIQIPLPSAGLYTVNIELEGKHVRRLAFDVVRATPQS
ncbi:hypothetical protein [Kribbella sp. VKM Ac-2566]|uniref:DUF6941 family protein n=1 Tax=Kribbella sp. VKM Ac-2566 TaxID=2512218 RepID=UPI00106275B5|nr:hypothetical protein [Kribbella sp. VKM Ac-2566]TDW91121.1 hypothetical protein EV647_4692 [Kribbella sp. VKM Ac-2566]